MARLVRYSSRFSARTPRFTALALGCGALFGCSFFSPSTSDYAKPKPGSGGDVANDTGGRAGTGPSVAGSESGEPSAGATTVGGVSAMGGEPGVLAGAAGEPEEPDPPAIPGQSVDASRYRFDEMIDQGTTFGLLTSYSADEKTVTAPGVALPVYQPFDNAQPAWWDYVVAEQLQTRVDTVVFPTRGVNSLTQTDFTGPGNMNPRRLALWAEALGRAGVKDHMSAICLVDTPFLPLVASTFHGTPASTLFDLSVKGDWNDVFWLRAIKPWFESVPSSFWYLDYGSPVIQLGPLPNTSFKNQLNNLSPLLTAIAELFKAQANVYPRFILDASWFTLEPTVATNPYVLGKSPWLDPTNASFAFANLGNYVTGTVVPGSTDLPRSSTDTYGNEVLTLLTGLTAARTANARLAVVQGLNNFGNGAGLYASEADGWDTPNQFLNLVRRQQDLKTVTLRLEAEACDRFSDTTSGNSGKSYRRTGDLDVRALAGGGWAVTDSAPSEWIEFDNVDFSSGNYDFMARFSTSGSGAGKDLEKRLEVVIDGHKLAPTILPDTVNSDTFAVTLLGQATISHGPHAVRVRFMDGFVDLDWLFMRKTDVRLALQVANGKYQSVIGAGGGDVRGTAPGPGVFEQLTFDDLNGGTLEDGDQVNLQVYDGYYLTVVAPGPSVQANQRKPGKQETFTVKLLSGDAVAKDDSSIALATANGHYLSTGTDADSTLNASATTIGDAETFKIHVF